ncbi:MAG: transketolase [Spirochaetales bacterium]|nr:transketolase [Spirochaetales bacterium]
MDYRGLAASAKTVRALSMDAIEKAKSGHPGLPLGCAEVGSYLFGEVLKHYPEDSHWINRDRFVLSAGHGSMLLYSLLYLSGYNVTLDDLKNFRQLKSKTPGHPEYGWTDGVETSTGPLGQGFANAVGMAIAAKRHAQRFNKEGYKLLDSRIYVICGDGDLMEGVSYEAGSLAGHLRLNNLIAIYDSNKTTIDGGTDIAFTENVAKRFKAQGWTVIRINGHDMENINRGFDLAEYTRIAENKPVLIVSETIIGKGAPTKQGTSSCHGAPLGPDEVAGCKDILDIHEDFYVDPVAAEYFETKKRQWKQGYEAWQKIFAEWSDKFPALRKELDDTFALKVPADTFDKMPEFKDGDMIATRNASHKIMNAITNDLNFFVSGSADLACSTMTYIRDSKPVCAEDYGRYNIEYGIREHAMGSIANGIYLFGGVLPVVGTFLSFVNYMKPAIRMAAIMRIPTIYLFSHDSVYVGEDGPTHQPVEHVSSLRLVPNVNVMRPADANETKVAWQIALQHTTHPNIIITTRQKVPVLGGCDMSNAFKGGYIIKKESKPNIDIIIIATGSEVSLALDSAKKLESEGKSVRVVSMFSTYLYDQQDDEYKESVLPKNIRTRIAVEAGIPDYWYKYVGLDGKVLGVNKFGISAKPEDLAEYYGLTTDNLCKVCREMIK